jgi:hypothetical protein
MEIKFRILDTHPDEHSITVRYYTDIVTEDYLAVSKNNDGSIIRTSEGYPVTCRTDYNLNIFQTPTPSKDEILQYIHRSAPVAWLEMHESILNPQIDTNLETLDDLKKVEQTFDTNSLTQPIVTS